MTMETPVPEYEVYAIRYCHRPDNVRSGAFYDHDPCGADPLPMDYFTWLAVSGTTAVAIDAGYRQETALRLGREYVAPPTETMKALGVDPADVQDVVVTHLHFDHTGHLPDFPHAKLVLQEAEMAFWTGRFAGRGQFARLHDPEDLAHVLRRNVAGQVRWVNGERTIRPGISVHLLAGHTPGMQVVRIHTAKGPVVLASDASHFYENIERDQPYRILGSLPLVYQAFDTINELADGRPELVVAGHDPQVLVRYPAASQSLSGIVARIA